MTRNKGKIALAVAFALVLAIQILKGLSTEPHLYPLIYSIFSYADGPIRRGLLPSLFHFAGYHTIDEQARLFAILHLVCLAAFVVLLIKYLRDQPARAGSLLFWLRALFLTGVTVPLMAATNFYGDTLLVTGLLAIHMLLLRRARGWAALLMLVLSLQHELMLVLALPLWLMHAYESPDWKRALWPPLAVFGFMTVFLLLAAENHTRLAVNVEGLCIAHRPANATTPHNGWDENCPYFLSTRMADEAQLFRFVVVGVYLPAMGLFPFLLPLFWHRLSFAHERRIPAVVRLLLMGLPLGLILVAVDIDRIIMLTLCVAWLLLEGTNRGREDSVERGETIMFAVALLFQLVLYYPSINYYAQGRFVPPEWSERLFLSPQNWMVEKFGDDLPPSLKPLYCADPRCAQ